MSVPTGYGNYPAGVTDNGPEFDLPSVEEFCEHPRIDYQVPVPQCADCGDFITEFLPEPEPIWGWSITPQGIEFQL